jgi:hypothetical protein
MRTHDHTRSRIRPLSDDETVLNLTRDRFLMRPAVPTYAARSSGKPVRCAEFIHHAFVLFINAHDTPQVVR